MFPLPVTPCDHDRKIPLRSPDVCRPYDRLNTVKVSCGNKSDVIGVFNQSGSE